MEIGDDVYYHLPGARNAINDPEIVYDEPHPKLGSEYNFGTLFVIDKTLEPGTPLRYIMKVVANSASLIDSQY